MIHCKFCDRQFTTVKGKSSHSRYCENNPMKSVRTPNKGNTGMKGRNQFSKARDEGREIPIVSLETRQKLSDTSKLQKWGTERRDNHSSAMKVAVLDNPDSYTSSNRGRTRQIEKYGIKFQGTWELAYYECCLATSLKVERCTERFEYEWNGIRTYNPDFYLPESDTYIEVKGYETDRDRAKWRDFTGRLLVIRKTDIMSMKQFLVNLI